MTLGILKVLRYADRVAIEYALDAELAKTDPPSHHPQTFPAMGAATLPDALRDDRCTWDNLRLLCTLPHTTDDDCVAAACKLLKQTLEAPRQEDADLKAARAILGIEPAPVEE